VKHDCVSSPRLFHRHDTRKGIQIGIRNVRMFGLHRSITIIKQSEVGEQRKKWAHKMRVLSSHIRYAILIRNGEKNYLSPFPLVAHLYILECLPWNVQSSICPPTCLGIEPHPCTVRSTGSINLGVRSCLERQNQWKINCLGISL
jgi:hypothetical protein